MRDVGDHFQLQQTHLPTLPRNHTYHPLAPPTYDHCHQNHTPTAQDTLDGQAGWLLLSSSGVRVAPRASFSETRICPIFLVLSDLATDILFSTGQRPDTLLTFHLRPYRMRIQHGTEGSILSQLRWKDERCSEGSAETWPRNRQSMLPSSS